MEPISLIRKNLAHLNYQKLNEIGGSNGIGRLDIVENRYVGMKSRGAMKHLVVQFY